MPNDLCGVLNFCSYYATMSEKDEIYPGFRAYWGAFDLAEVIIGDRGKALSIESSLEILDKFQAAGWEDVVRVEFEDEKQNQEAVRQLNRELNSIRFHSRSAPNPDFGKKESGKNLPPKLYYAVWEYV
jgi:hypothetical protein